MDSQEKLNYEQALEIEYDKERLERARAEQRKEKMIQIKKRQDAKR